MRIDSHQHYWKLERGDYDWISPDMKAIYRDFVPEDLEAHLDAKGIDRTIVVQAAPTLSDTEFMLELADRHDRIVGVVGWIDLASPDYRSQYEQFKRNPKFVGFRIMIQAMENAEEVLEPNIIEALRFFAAEGVPVDLLLKSNQLLATLKLLELVPNLRGVIDHIAKPQIAEGEWEPWSTQMAQAASHPGIYCKLSGMVTEADHQRWKPEDFVRYVRHIVEVFGKDRVMFGSDWPVCLLAASYDQVIDVLEQALPETLSVKEKAAVYGGNAMTFYRLTGGTAE
ncbi:amidohydrolase family protein [Paenibacillus cremeus]|uniref:Amidohydrolase family protein n=1 Tax=Paenibacillus cremeus TaxID=2163881 RepID=A0A559JKA6_9BACL|nr:amidohydrolase family protein [Paenibacillus cremeus]TVY00321.1 amidohydrolase family protein [Paenibacillus cremeus]